MRDAIIATGILSWLGAMAAVILDAQKQRAKCGSEE